MKYKHFNGKKTTTFTRKKDKNEKSQARIAVKLHFHMLLEAENWFNHLGRRLARYQESLLCAYCVKQEFYHWEYVLKI